MKESSEHRSDAFMPCLADEIKAAGYEVLKHLNSLPEIDATTF